MAISSSRCLRASRDFLAATLFLFRLSKYLPSFESNMLDDDDLGALLRLPLPGVPLPFDDESIVDELVDELDMSEQLDNSDIFDGFDGVNRLTMFKQLLVFGTIC